jgi:hypothetical protein
MSNIHFSSQTDLWGTPPIRDEKPLHNIAGRVAA